MSKDPTSIELRYDPRHVTIHGVTRHGNHQFEAPAISRITGTLWMGGCVDGLNLPREIVHVVSLYPWESYRYHEDVRSVLSVRTYDDDVSKIDSATIDSVVDWIVSRLLDGQTLVHCQAGLNRSGLYSALALMRMGLDSDSAIRLLREGRDKAVLCNVSFERYLRSRDACGEIAT